MMVKKAEKKVTYLSGFIKYISECWISKSEAFLLTIDSKLILFLFSVSNRYTLLLGIEIKYLLQIYLPTVLEKLKAHMHPSRKSYTYTLGPLNRPLYYIHLKLRDKL